MVKTWIPKVWQEQKQNCPSDSWLSLSLYSSEHLWWDLKPRWWELPLYRCDAGVEDNALGTRKKLCVAASMPSPVGFTPNTHPKAKTSDCLQKGSLSSSVSGDSCWMISGARWHSQPLGILSLSSLRLQSETTLETRQNVIASRVSCCQTTVKMEHRIAVAVERRVEGGAFYEALQLCILLQFPMYLTSFNSVV